MLRWFDPPTEARSGFGTQMIRIGILSAALLVHVSGVSIASSVGRAPQFVTIDFRNGLPTADSSTGHAVADLRSSKEVPESALGAHEIQIYRAAASRGDPVGEFYLGEAYYDGVGVSQDQSRGIGYLRSAAVRGYARAETFLGIVEYLQAPGAPGRSRAWYWLHQGAHDGNRLAQRDLGIISLDDRSSSSVDDAMHWLHLAALQGDVVSQRLMGELNATTSSDTPSPEAAVFWLTEAAKDGDRIALSDLIHIWSMTKQIHAGFGPPETLSGALVLTTSPQTATQLGNFYFGRSPASAALAVELYRGAAQNGYGPASFGLAEAYLFGRGITANAYLARRGFKDATAQGYVRARVNLGTMYYQGMGVRKSLTRAASEYRLAATHGSAQGAYYLAMMFQTGQGVKMNVPEALHWYRVAAGRGLPVAQRVVASLPNPRSAGISPAQQRVYWLRRAAEGGDAVAARELAELYRRGVGVKLSRPRALHWLQRAAKLGDQPALVDSALLEATEPTTANQARAGRSALRRMALAGSSSAGFNLGALYARGDGVTRDDHRAVIWWTVAARQHDQDAMIALAIAYISGAGVKEDRSKAVTLLKQVRVQNLDPERRRIVEQKLITLH